MASLKKLSTLPPVGEPDKEGLIAAAEKLKTQIAAMQNMLYAQHQFSVLLLIQGMDASGKDGLINRAFSGLNPAGIRVYSWKKPTETELDHDFLWRIHQAAPPKGMIHIFNRSQYEDILVPSVFGGVPEAEIEKRYDRINEFEQLLTESGTLILKFYLHVSEEEQKKRLDERLQMPEKQWKYDPADMTVLKNRDKFLAVYERILKHCDKPVPWHIIPADKNRYKEYLVLKILAEALEKLPLAYPKLQK